MSGLVRRVDGVDRTERVRGALVDVAVSGYLGVAELRMALLTRQRRLARPTDVAAVARPEQFNESLVEGFEEVLALGGNAGLTLRRPT